MLHNRLAMSKTERQSEAEKRHGKVLIVKKEIEELMQNYKYLYSDQIYRWFDIDDKFVVKKCIEKILRERKVFYNSDSGILQNIAYYGMFDQNYLNAFWVMIALNNIQKNMGNHIYIHLPNLSKDNTCKKISFFIKPESRESQILVIRKGTEQSSNIEIQMNDCDDERFMPERFILIDSEDQIPYIQIKNVKAYAILTDENVTFIQGN